MFGSRVIQNEGDRRRQGTVVVWTTDHVDQDCGGRQLFFFFDSSALYREIKVVRMDSLTAPFFIQWIVVHDRSSLVESIDWLNPFLCVKREERREKREREERREERKRKRKIHLNIPN